MAEFKRVNSSQKPAVTFSISSSLSGYFPIGSEREKKSFFFSKKGEKIDCTH